MALQTNIRLPDQARTAVISILNQRLVDAIDLQLHMRQAHWTIRSPRFYSLHTFFGELYDQLDEPIDQIAERVSQLAGELAATASHVAKATTLPPYPTTITSGQAHIEALTKSLSTFANAVRADIDRCAAVGDAVSADLLTGVGRLVDKQLWMVEAHNQPKD